MDANDTQAAKITKMYEYIEQRRAELTATEDAEFAKRMRQYWSASNNSKATLEKIRVLDEEIPKTLKAKNKMNLILFVVILLVAFANQYFEFIERSNQIILGVAFFAYIIIDVLTDKLETNNKTAKRESWKAQADFYKHEMICCGGGNVEYENEYIKAQKMDDIESEEIFNKLYLLSVEIAILHGLKSKLQFVKF